MIDGYPVARPGVVSRLVGDELIIVFPDRGEVKVLNEVASRIWRLIDGNHSISQITQVVCDEYLVAPRQAEEDISEFLQLLLEKDMISLESRSS